jgi:hypothetical protein
MASVVLRQLKQLLLLLGLLLAPTAYCAADGDYIRELIASAHNKQLAQRPEWRKLLHYKPRLLPNHYQSQVDAPRFFNAADGKENPESELDATLTAFFAGFPDDVDAQQLHPQCLFVARYQWLKQELHFDAARLPEYRCQRFEEWLQTLDPAGATLIFPTAYINSPASMFGHTLLRIDAHGQNEQTRLLAYALNFGADTGNDGGLAYAVKGLLGGYPGGFSVLPYYLKVREYSDMENRDIWEYQLNLSEAETRTLLLHAWELRGIWFDYYFFDENCSYHLLSLLETARPDLQLTAHFGAWAIPSDTVRVVDGAGLVSTIIFRPSRHAQLSYRLAKLDEPQIALIKALGMGEITPADERITTLPLPQQAETLEMAHEFAAYRSGADDGPMLHTLLQARSALAVTTPKVNAPAGTRPDRGHNTGRSSLLAGREAQQNYLELQLRPAYHDLLDPQAGYADGAQIAFFTVALRHNGTTDETRLQNFTPVEIVSLTPISDVATPISWQFNFGLTRKQGQQSNDMLATVNGGAGLSWPMGMRSISYALLTAGLDASKDELRKGYAFGAGPSIGVLSQLTEAWALHLFAGSRYYSAGDHHHEKNIGIEQRYTLNDSNTLRLSWSRQRQLGDEFSDFNLSWQRFF